MVLIAVALFLLVSAWVFREALSTVVPNINAIPYGGISYAHMSMNNPLGDHDFYCLDKGCDDRGGFQGKQTGHLYANRIDAVKGHALITNR